MGTFRKSLKGGANSRQISENLKKLNKDLKRTESVLNEIRRRNRVPPSLQSLAGGRSIFPKLIKQKILKLKLLMK